MNYDGEELEDGTEFLMENDDAVTTLSRLIVEARSVKETPVPEPRIVIVVEGGLVQGVISDHVAHAPKVAVLDYDIEGCDDTVLTYLTQPNGDRVPAFVAQEFITGAAINLDEVFEG
jgi:hypothetical protein